MKDLDYEYFYEDKGDEKYCYPKTNILINKANIRDAEKLHVFERKMSSARYFELLNEGVTGKFDLKHLKSIHKYLFQDVYEWAGQIRTVDIAKGNLFCRTPFINDMFNDLYCQLKKEAFLKDVTDISVMSERIAFYLSEVNSIHPFREGNGRTQRMYCHQLCAYNGRFDISFDKVLPEEMISASVASFIKNYEPMIKTMEKCLIKLK